MNRSLEFKGLICRQHRLKWNEWRNRKVFALLLARIAKLRAKSAKLAALSEGERWHTLSLLSSTVTLANHVHHVSVMYVKEGSFSFTFLQWRT